MLLTFLSGVIVMIILPCLIGTILRRLRNSASSFFSSADSWSSLMSMPLKKVCSFCPSIYPYLSVDC